ncbi:MAG TPA: extracellular solute-binding protein [Limnochordia bacterium]
MIIARTSIARWQTILLWTIGYLLAIAAPGHGGAVELTFMTWFAGGGRTLEKHEALIDRFEELHPGITVQMLQVGYGGYGERLLTQIAGGAGPDVVAIPYQDFPAFARAGALVSLEKWLRSDREVNVDDIFPSAWPAVTYEGVRYGLPFDLSAQWMAYVPELFSQAGLDDPIALYQRGAWDWTHLREAATKLTRRDPRGAPTQIGMILQFDEIMGQPWLYQTGTTPFTPDLESARLTDPRIRDALEFLRQMAVDEGTLLGAWSSPVADPKTGHFGVWPQWITIPYFFEGAPFRANIVPAVEGPVGRVTTGHIHSISIWTGSSHPEEAWEFTKFLTGPVGYRYVIEQGLAPLRRSLASYYVEQVSGTVGFDGARLFLADIGRFRLYQITPEWMRVRGVILDGLAPVWQGSKPLEVALEEIQAGINAILAEAR